VCPLWRAFSLRCPAPAWSLQKQLAIVHDEPGVTRDRRTPGPHGGAGVPSGGHRGGPHAPTFLSGGTQPPLPPSPALQKTRGRMKRRRRAAREAAEAAAAAGEGVVSATSDATLSG